MSTTKHQITTDFIVMNAAKKAVPEKFTPTFYENISAKYDGFGGYELISCHEFSGDWSNWEMHPKGDEIVMLMSGKATVVLETEPEQSIELKEVGSYVIIPAGTWHTAKTDVATKMLFITPGQDTQHKDL